MEYDEKFYDSTNPAYPKDANTPRKGHGSYKRSLLTGTLQGTLVTHQPLHVGSGEMVPPDFVGVKSDVPLLKPFFMVDGRLTIPGSSYKGAVRSFVEAITASCIHKTRTRVDQSLRECRFNGKRRSGEICPACRIFGAMGYQGHVSFSDLPRFEGDETTIHMIPPQFLPKGDSQRRHYPHNLKDTRRALWPLEVAPIGSRFSFRIQFSNVELAEVGLLLLALGQGESPIALKLGAGKSAGLGATQIDTLQATSMATDQMYLHYDAESLEVPIDSAAAIQAALDADGLVDTGALQKLQRNLGLNHFV